MNKTSHVESDATIVLCLAVVATIRASLDKSHGSEFADAFVADHIGAIWRAARTRQYGRVGAELQMNPHEPQHTGQGSSPHD